MYQLNRQGWGAAVLCLAGLSAQGGLLFTSNNGGLIPDDEGVSERTDTITVPESAFGAGYTISDVNVIINLTGGWNGDLYARLDYAPIGGGNGSVVLLNRVGRVLGDEWLGNGYSSAGFDRVKLDDSAQVDIHVYGGTDPNPPAPSDTSYQPDRRTADPTIATTGSSRGSTLALAFNGQYAAGTWTISFSDWSSGDQSTLTSWSMDITAVPEPVTTALIVFGVIFGSFRLFRYLRARRLRTA